MKKTGLVLLLILFILLNNTAGAQDINWDKLVDAIIICESGGRADAVSNAGAIGLMGILPKGAMAEFNQEAKKTGLLQIGYGKDEIDVRYTYDYFHFSDRQGKDVVIEIDKNDLYDEEVNRIVGIWYLHRLHEHYKCDTIEKILIAYNWGIGNCRKHNFNPKMVPKSTKHYVQRVLALYNKGVK